LVFKNTYSIRNESTRKVDGIARTIKIISPNTPFTAAPNRADISITSIKIG
jgi:hypothetical protein